MGPQKRKKDKREMEEGKRRHRHRQRFLARSMHERMFSSPPSPFSSNFAKVAAPYQVVFWRLTVSLELSLLCQV